jgi:hypothetical protein
MVNSALDVPRASNVPEGSTVLVLGKGDGTTLVTGFAFWAVALFGLGYFIGTRREKTPRPQGKKRR